MAPAEDDEETSVSSATSLDSNDSGDDADAVDASAARKRRTPKLKLPKNPFLVLRDGLLVNSSKRNAAGGDGEEATERSSEGVDDEAEEEEEAALDGESIPEDETDHGGTNFARVWRCPGASADGGSGGAPTCSSPGSDPRCTHSLYGRGGGDEDECQTRDRIGPNADGGLVYHALLLPDDYDADGPGKVRSLNPKDYDADSGAPKPRRKSPFPLKSSEFFSSLTVLGRPNVESQAEAGYDELWDTSLRTSVTNSVASRKSESEREGARWIFTGAMNGWPGLATLELRALEVEETGFITGRKKGWKALWRAEREGAEGVDPAAACAARRTGGGEKQRRVRAKLRAPEWSARGWSEKSPGFLFWVTGPTVAEPVVSSPRLTYGTNVQGLFKCPEDDDPLCEHVTMVCHRYATGGRDETAKDKLTYHSLALLEWNHRQYCTVVEIGWLNGIGGYKGKVNWFDDKDAPQTALYGSLPPEMVLPWRNTMSEIRCYDVPFRDLAAFQSYVAKYEGHAGRFVDPVYPFSHEVRLTYRSRRNVAAYLLNYIRRDRTYSEMRRNCQTFTSDICGFLAGKKGVQPYHPVNKVQYVNQKHKFLYESSKYKGR